MDLGRAHKRHTSKGQRTWNLFGTLFYSWLMDNTCLRYHDLVTRRYAFCFLVVESRHCSCFTSHLQVQYLGRVPYE